jgi:response regulator RpfG family c-di-GMP phosphodiesterase
LVEQNKKSILVVDDEPDIVTIIKMALQRNGWVIKEFTNPVLALQYFEQYSTNYDAVLSDIRMPGMNGFDLIRKIKAIKPDVRIFLMTALDISMSELEKVLPSVKVDGLIEKPVSMSMLVSVIEKGTTTKKRSYHSYEVDGDDVVSLEYG